MPEVAPIEMFFNTFKRRLNSVKVVSSVDLKSEEGREMVQQVIGTFSKAEVIRYYHKLMDELCTGFHEVNERYTHDGHN